MARFRIDYSCSDYRHGFIEADSIEEAQAKFDEDGPAELDGDEWDDSDDYQVANVRFVCPKDGAEVEAGESCEECGVLFDLACPDCHQAGYHADSCPTMAAPATEASA